jgi:hypothetical protein
MMRSRIQAAEMRVLRLVKGVMRRDRLRNENITAELDMKYILQLIHRGDSAEMVRTCQENASQQNSTEMATMETKHHTPPRTST